MDMAQVQQGCGFTISKEAAMRIRGIVCGVDGVLTNGQIGYTAHRCEIQFFDVRDGLAMRLASWIGLEVAWITGRVSTQISQRAQDLNVRIYPGYANKELGLRTIAHDFNLCCHDLAYVGDDLNDLLAFRIAGCPIAVASASPEVKAEAAYITQAPGGQGAIREIVEAILRAQGRWDEAVANYLNILREPERIAKTAPAEE